MGKYPRLREEAERVMSTFLREQEERCKSHVSEVKTLDKDERIACCILVTSSCNFARGSAYSIASLFHMKDFHV